MPYFDEQEGIYILTDEEDRSHRAPGLDHILTREELARGGRNGTGAAKRRSPSFYTAQATHRANIRWAKHRATNASQTTPSFA